MFHPIVLQQNAPVNVVKYKVTKLWLHVACSVILPLTLYSTVVKEKRTYKPQEQGHDHLVSPQAFSLLFEFFYHSP